MYGKELILDLEKCNVAMFKRESIQQYCEELCRLIDMQACDFHFWDDEGVAEPQTDPKTDGVSAVQFILTSSIVIHSLHQLSTVFINIFSCKDFDTDKAMIFSQSWFGAKKVTDIVVVRGNEVI